MLQSLNWHEMVGMACPLDFKRLLRLLIAEKSGFSPERRRFLKTATVGTLATATLTGCGSFDRWVLGDNQRLSHEVMILGGGLSGLMAAYHLKKNHTPYRLFEASSRLGGRIQTLRHFNSSQQVAELGAEFFEGSHNSVYQLCKDLNLGVEDVSYNLKQDRAIYWLKGKVVSEADFRKLLRPLAIKFAQLRQELFSVSDLELSPKSVGTFSQAQVIDLMSVGNILEELKATSRVEAIECFESLCASEWGVEAKEINLLQFLIRLDFEERAALAGSQKIYRVSGGTSQIIDVLGARVQGVVPDSSMKLDYQVIAIREKSGGYECTFKTPKGSDIIWARQIICTLPWSLLKDVDGIQNLKLGSAAAGEVIAKASYATQAKVVSSFKEPFWRKKEKVLPSFQGIFRGDLGGQIYWDSSRGQAGTHGLLTSQRGGAAGIRTGASGGEETAKDLQKFFSEVPAAESTQVMNWTSKPFARGSRYNVGPGGYLKYLDLLSTENDQVRFYFAGEHISFRDFGTMNGAIETAVVAANKAMQIL
ncbi:MAG: FAD-dependent oxidoreductase [Bdellovibrionaceae bacterium]|nr:FAD-dependent oxidoreductase [Pseudobdellovibrionaceae bacterium]